MALNWKELCFKVGSLIMYIYMYITYIIFHVYFYIFDKNSNSENPVIMCIHTLSKYMISSFECELQFIMSNLYCPHFAIISTVNGSSVHILNLFLLLLEKCSVRFLHISINVLKTIIT